LAALRFLSLLPCLLRTFGFLVLALQRFFLTPCRLQRSFPLVRVNVRSWGDVILVYGRRGEVSLAAASVSEQLPRTGNTPINAGTLKFR
jgi:hypothetical protein